MRDSKRFSASKAISKLQPLQLSEEQNVMNTWRKKVETFLDDIFWQTLMGLLVLYALFFNNIRILCIAPAYDNACDWTTLIVFLLFVIDILLESFSRQGYFNSFFFWFYSISTIFLLLQLGWISSGAGTVEYVLVQAGTYFRTVWLAQIIRIVRGFHLSNMKKRYKELQDQKENEMEESHTKKNKRLGSTTTLVVLPKTEDQPGTFSSYLPKITRKRTVGYSHFSKVKLEGNYDENVSAVPVPETESKLSRMIQYLTQQRIILVILLVIITITCLVVDLYFGVSSSYDIGVSYLDNEYGSIPQEDFKLLCNSFCTFQSNDMYPLVIVQGPACNYSISSSSLENLRQEDLVTVTKPQFSITVSIKYYNTLTAGLSIAKVFFIAIVFFICSLMASTEITRYVLIPIESMIEKVNILKSNPMAFCSKEVDELGVYQMENRGKKANQPYELKVLDGVFMVIAKLLAVEFGESGTKVVVENLRVNDYINPMISGQKIDGVFGFCMIPQFHELTEALQERIVPYVNYLGEVIHSTIDKYFGYTNKNIGDSFFFLWRLFKNDINYTEEGMYLLDYRSSMLADMSLLAAIKIQAKIHKLEHIINQTDYPEIKAHIQDYKVSIPFGLHIGWAIEGTIGSIFKIESSYLSPHVNIAARLEGATKFYKVPVLLSGQLFSALSPHARSFCREIDRIELKGSKLAISLFTIDLNFDVLTIKECKYRGCSQKEKRNQRTKNKNLLRFEIENHKIVGSELFEKDPDIIEMRMKINTDFINEFKKGYGEYISGNWEKAADILKNANSLTLNDGPTLYLLNYMNLHQNSAPAGWKGFHALGEK